MKLISVKKETSFKLNAMSDAGFYFSWYQMFDVLIFADTRRSVLGFLVFFLSNFTTSQNSILRWLQRESTSSCSEKTPAMQKVSPIKVLLLNVTYQEAAYTEVKIKTSTI